MPATNPYTDNPASEAQIRFIGKLGGDTLHAHKLSKKEASAYIDELKGSPAQPASDAPAHDAPSDPDSDLQRAVAHLRALNLEGQLNSFTDSLLAQYDRKGYLSDKQVSAVLRKMADTSQPGDPITVTEPGVYETEGHIYIVKPNKTKTRLYAKELIETPGTYRLTETGEHADIEFTYAPGVIHKLTPEMKMPLDRAKELTIRYGRCIVCGRNLKAAKSVEQGIGPVCIKSFNHINH